MGIICHTSLVVHQYTLVKIMPISLRIERTIRINFEIEVIAYDSGLD